MQWLVKNGRTEGKVGIRTAIRRKPFFFTNFLFKNRYRNKKPDSILAGVPGQIVLHSQAPFGAYFALSVEP